MSVLDLILSQQEILLTCAVAVVPLLAALILIMLPHARRARQQSAQRRQEEQIRRRALREATAQARLDALSAQRQALNETATGIELVTEKLRAVARAVKAIPAQPAAEQEPSTAASTSAGLAGTAVPKTAASGSQAGAGQPQADSASGEETPAAIQQILDSVFDDEELNARYAMLLRDVDPISAADLAAQCSEIAAQLHLRPPYTPVRR